MSSLCPGYESFLSLPLIRISYSRLTIFFSNFLLGNWKGCTGQFTLHVSRSPSYFFFIIGKQKQYYISRSESRFLRNDLLSMIVFELEYIRTSELLVLPNRP